MSIASGGKGVSKPRKSVNPIPWMLRRVIRLPRRPAEWRHIPLRRLNALAATWPPCSQWRSRFFRRCHRGGAGFVCLEPRGDGVREAHAGERANGRQQSDPERAADDRVDDRSHRQEEADRDAGDAGQDEEDGFRDDVDAAAAHRGDAQARVPEKREGEDCRGDPNERSPYFTASLSVALQTDA